MIRPSELIGRNATIVTRVVPEAYPELYMTAAQLDEAGRLYAEVIRKEREEAVLREAGSPKTSPAKWENVATQLARLPAPESAGQE